MSDTEGKQEDMISKKKKRNNIVCELACYIGIIVICLMIIPTYVLQRTQVEGDSMMDTLQNSQNLLVEKVSYHFKNPDRFDIITFYPKGRDHKEYYIKRVIGLPGETIQIKGNVIYINGKVITEHYGREPMQNGGIAENPIKLGKDEFFVLGDNRNYSVDSRDGEEVGIVKKRNIDGHAFIRIYPLSKFGLLNG